MSETEIRRRLAALAYAPMRTRRGDPGRRQAQAVIAEIRTLRHRLRISVDKETKPR